MNSSEVTIPTHLHIPKSLTALPQSLSCNFTCLSHFIHSISLPDSLIIMWKGTAPALCSEAEYCCWYSLLILMSNGKPSTLWSPHIKHFLSMRYGIHILYSTNIFYTWKCSDDALWKSHEKIIFTTGLNLGTRLLVEYDHLQMFWPGIIQVPKVSTNSSCSIVFFRASIRQSILGWMLLSCKNTLSQWDYSLVCSLTIVVLQQVIITKPLLHLHGEEYRQPLPN